MARIVSLAILLGLVVSLVNSFPDVQRLRRNGRNRLARQSNQRPRDECSTFDGGINMCNYESHENMVRRLETLASRYPQLAQVGSIGKSKEGRELVYIKISDNVQRRSLMEPMFKFVANMHGDETVGRELLIYMAEYLLFNYEHNPRVKKLVDATEIFLLPTLNPDGYSRSNEGQCQSGGGFLGFGQGGRENANGVDLNRDFPRQYEDKGKPVEALYQGRQAETVAAMRWIVSNPFVLSANMHAGAVVASYPFDDTPLHRNGAYGKSPDDDFFKYVAKLYSQNHPTMHKGDSCRDDFPGGITNGAKWYDVPGGMQDFNYVYSNCFEITLELTCCKHPSKQNLIQEWLNNKESMLRYMESVHRGVKGFVVDQDSAPIPNAIVRVTGNEKIIKTTQLGEFWRLLAPGNYELVAEAPGYLPSQPFQATIVEGQPPVFNQFTLQRQN